MTTKEALIRGNCAMQGRRLSALVKASGWTPAHIYAVLRGKKKSAQVDEYFAAALNINLQTLRGDAKE